MRNVNLNIYILTKLCKDVNRKCNRIIPLIDCQITIYCLTNHITEIKHNIVLLIIYLKPSVKIENTRF